MKRIILYVFILLNSVAFAQEEPTYDNSPRTINESNNKDWYKNLVVGSYVGLGYNNGWLLDFSPGVGYSFLNDFAVVGVGAAYVYAESIRNLDYTDKFNTIGPRAYAQINVFSNFYLHGEYQYLTYRLKRVYKNLDFTENLYGLSEPVVFVGAGYTGNFADGLSFYTEFLIDLKYNIETSPRISPITFRMGVFYGF